MRATRATSGHPATAHDRSPLADPRAQRQLRRAIGLSGAIVLPAALALVKQLRYTGLYSIEAGGGGGADPYQNVQSIYDVLIPGI